MPAFLAVRDCKSGNTLTPGNFLYKQLNLFTPYFLPFLHIHLLSPY